MIKSEDGRVEFTGVNYERAEMLGVPKHVLEQTQIEILVHDLGAILSGISLKLGRVTTIQIVEEAVKLSLDPRAASYSEEEED